MEPQRGDERKGRDAAIRELRELKRIISLVSRALTSWVVGVPSIFALIRVIGGYPSHRPSRLCTSLAATLLLCATASAQHLWWNLEGQRDATCLYGEITVLATHPAIYYCGANWHPGEPAGGYCGIQHNSTRERRTIFSIWDTSPQLHPKVTEADPDTVFGRFGGEGEGGHTHMLWPWNTNDTFPVLRSQAAWQRDQHHRRALLHLRPEHREMAA